MPTAPTRLTATSASAGSAPTRKAASSASAGSAPTRKAAASASAGSAPSRLASVTSVVVPGADVSYYDEEILILANPAASYGIRVGHFVSGVGIESGTRVTVISGTFYFATGDTFDPALAKAYQPGDTLIIPAGVSMYAASREQETVLQLHGTGPWGITYRNLTGDPRNKKM